MSSTHHRTPVAHATYGHQPRWRVTSSAQPWQRRLALAGDGGIDLAPYPHVHAWIARIQALPGYVPMKGLEA